MAETAADAAIESFAHTLDAVPGAERVRFWWRDDDATTHIPQLERLLRLSARLDVPLNLSVIPGRIETSLVGFLKDYPKIAVLVHGWTHTNHSPEEIRSCEFPLERSVAEIEFELSAALSTLRQAFPEQCLPVLVPPWNIFPPELEPLLVKLGYVGISRGSFEELTIKYQDDRLVHANTHVDPIDWRTLGLSDLAALARAFARRIRKGRLGPFGILTHHASQKEEVWDFCERFWRMIARHDRAEVVSARTIFCE
jgi:hypothetical protein